MVEMLGMYCNASNTSANLSVSCINHALAIGLDVVLLLCFILLFFFKSSSIYSRCGIKVVFPLQFVSSVYNGLVGLLYIVSGIFILSMQYRESNSLFPWHWWAVVLFHGVTWSLVSVTLSLKRGTLPLVPLKALSVLAFLFAGIVCGISSVDSIIQKKVSYEIALDFMSLLGSCLLVFCSYTVNNHLVDEKSDLCDPLNDVVDKENNENQRINVTPFSSAGFWSKMSFWWLNGLMKKGKVENLDDKDIPMLREEDRAGSCYSMFMHRFNKQREVDSSKPPSVLKTLVICHWKEIVVTGIFALLKILSLSAGPLLLNAFIRVAEGKRRFEHEGYVLALILLTSKFLESLSQRQWFFRSRLIGLKVRSFLSVAIYKKQIKLSNAAKLVHSSGEIMNYITVDAYRIGEFPFWFHQTWTTCLQICLALGILFSAVGLATIASMVAIVLTVVCNTPLAKLQHEFQTKLMGAQDERLKAVSEALINIKVLKLYAWENHFKNVIRNLREIELKWLSAVQIRKACGSILFWSSPVVVSAATFGACYVLGIPLNASNVFTFVATVRIVQDPVRDIPDVIGAVIQARVSFERIINFLEAPELEISSVRQKINTKKLDHCISIESASLSWEENPSKLTLSNINLKVRPGEKVAICGEVGSGKSTLLAAVLGEVPIIHGKVQAFGSMAYVSQSAWIQTGSIRDNILFGLPMDQRRYHETLKRCSLVKDLDSLPYGDLTEIGERGVNLSGGQKQRVQLARALYQNADVYLLDDPFSAVDAETATSLFNEYVMEALFGKTVLLVTHQVDFLPAFDYVLLMSNGEVLDAAPYDQLVESSKEFQSLVDAHKETAGSERLTDVSYPKNKESESELEYESESEAESSPREIRTYGDKNPKTASSSSSSVRDQLIKQEQREVGDTGFMPYIQYLNQNKGFFFFTVAVVSHAIFVVGQIIQNTWMAKNVENSDVTNLKLILVYLLIGFTSMFFLVSRSLNTVVLGVKSSRSLFNQLLDSLFLAPMSFHDSTPLGRILNRVSTDLSIVDLDLPFNMVFALGKSTNFYSSLGVLVFVTWQVLIVSIPMLVLAFRLQRYYFATAKALMRINGTSKSFVANHVAESIAGAMVIRAFKEEDRFLDNFLPLVDNNAAPFFLNFVANEWLIGRLELLGAILLSSSALFMVLLPPGTFTSGLIGMALSYGLSMNNSLVLSVQNQCTLANYVISVERLYQYMNIPSEAPQVIESNRPPVNWPTVGQVQIQDLEIKYREDGPLVLHGINCTFEGGHKIGIVGRTGSGKTTLIGALFRLVEPAGGRIMVDGIDTCTIGLHDLRSRFGIIPQDPTLFAGTVRYNLDPLGQHTDNEIWEVLKKCQLKEVVEEKEGGLDSLVVEGGSNWSMGQRQLFCLGRALIKRSKILVLDEATASIDNATDTIIQKTIRTEFADCTVITVAHRIPTVMDCTKVLAITDGKIAEYDEPEKLMKTEGSLFRQLVKEYWSHNHQINLD